MALIRLNNQSLTSVTTLPAGVGGKILKMEISEITASTSRASATSYADDLDFGSFTPSETTSTVFIYGVSNFDSESTRYCYYNWVINGTDYTSTGSTPVGTHSFYSSTSLNDGALMPSTIITSVDNTDGSAITVVCQGKVNTGTLWVNRTDNAAYTGSPSSVLFMEVAS
jgi:hypothetical protein